MARSSSSADVFLAVASPARRLLLDRLSSREQTVRSLAAPFHTTLPAVSQQLRILRAAGLVSSRRIGRYRVYHLHGDRLRELGLWVQKYERFWSMRPPRTFVEEKMEKTEPRPLTDLTDGEWRSD